MNNNNKSFYSSLVSVGFFRGLSFVVAGYFVIAVSKWFPPSEFGTYSLVFSVIQISCAAMLSWPNQAFLRYGRESFVKNNTLGTALGSRIIIHIIMMVAVTPITTIGYHYVAKFVGVNPADLLIVTLISFAILPINEMLLIGAQASGRFFAYGVSPLIQRSGQIIAILFVVYGFEAKWHVLIAGTIFGYVMSAIVTFFNIPKNTLQPKFSATDLRQTIRHSWSMPLATLGAFLLQWVDLWLIRMYYDETEVGYYAWAYSIVLLATNILVPLAAILSPRVVDCVVKSDTNQIRTITNGLFSFCLLIGIFIPLLICIGGGLLRDYIPIVYVSSFPILLVLSSTFMSQLGMALMEPLTYSVEKLVPFMVLIVSLMVSIKVIISLFLLPILGVSGTAIATVLCYSFGMVLQWALLRKHFGNIIPCSGPLFVLTIIAMVVGYCFPLHEKETFLYGIFNAGIGLYVLKKFGFLKELPPTLARFFGTPIYLWLKN